MTKTPDKDLLPEYDFSKGVRGKYAARVAKASGAALEVAPSDVQDAWNKEIERRIAAHERGEGKVYDLDEVMDEARRIAP
jgi:Putative addiction module component